MRTVLGIFSEREKADQAIGELESHGYNPKDISIVMREAETAPADNTAEHAAGGTVSGATVGGTIGGIAGLLIGIGAIAIPGIGPLLAAGPIAGALGLTGAAATTVTGVISGGVAGGIFGALTGLGIPADEVTVYEKRVSEGAILLATTLKSDTDEDRVKASFERYGADQVRTIQTG